MRKPRSLCGRGQALPGEESSTCRELFQLLLDQGHGCSPLCYEDFQEKSNKCVTWAVGGSGLLCDQSHSSLREGQRPNVTQKCLEELQEMYQIAKANTPQPASM